MIGVTLVACLAAIVFRTPIRSRIWAWQIGRASRMEDRVTPLTLLCNAGDAGRWGTETLLGHADAEIRQFGVVVLQHLGSDWARLSLLNLLGDPSEAVREMAALGLAIQGDTSIIPELLGLYRRGDVGTASAACVALSRLGSPEAVAALAVLAAEPADARRRAALVDALTAIGTPACGSALVSLLADDRTCDVTDRAEQILSRFAPVAAAHGFAESSDREPASRPAADRRPGTVAERAAAGLARITGLAPPFASDLTQDQRDEAERIWRGWLGDHGAVP